jgi:hypothetical protein
MLTPVTVEAGQATGEWVAALLTKIIIERKLGCD